MFGFHVIKRLLFILVSLSITAVFTQGSVKITCSVPAVELLQETVLTCHFPEDLSVTKKDFSVYHYDKGVNSDAVLDCWWHGGGLECFTNSNIQYNKVVSNHLKFTFRRVTSNITGVYACQVVGYDPSLFETCLLKIKTGNTLCNIPPVKPMGATSLTCTFPEDISLSKHDFSVVHINGTGKPILDCLWRDGNLECFNTSGFEFNMIVSNTLTIEIPRTFSNMTGLYYCKTSSSSKDVQYCKLEILMDSTDSDQNTIPMAIAISLGLMSIGAIISIVIIVILKEETVMDTTNSDHNALPMAIGISLGLVVIGAIITLVIIFILRRRSVCVKSAAVRKSNDHQSPSEERPLTERRTNQTQRREEVTKKFQEYFVNKTREMYQNIFEVFYFVPPVYFNKTKCTIRSVAKQDVYIPHLPDQNEVRHDRAMQHMIFCLRHVAKRGKEQMFVLTQFQYKDYLSNVSGDYKEHCLPVPASLPQDAEDTGSVDFLIIHRRHGVIAGVVKVLRDDEETGGDKADDEVVTEVSNALEKLKNACRIVSHVMSDQHNTSFNIRQFLVLVNIKESNFQQSLKARKDVLKKLKMCWPICFGQLPAHNIRHKTEPPSLTQFEKLWRHVTAERKDVLIMNDELYATMIARFCGPATISVLSIPSESVSYQLPKTLDQAVSLTGDLFERVTLYPDMTDLLDKPRLCLVGPPSTGKTKMLGLVGRKWISDGHNVEIIYTSPGGGAAANQLKKLLNGINPSLPQINCYLQEGKIKNIVKNLKEKATKNPIFAILDEVNFQKLNEKNFKSFLSKLGDSSNLHVWMAGCITEHLDIKQTELLHLRTDVLSCPPSILKQADLLNRYRDSQYPPPTEGPPVKHFQHVGDGHSSGDQPHGCGCCAISIARFLTQTLRIGADDQKDIYISQETNIQSLKQASRLRYSDVLILFECDVDENTLVVKSLQSSGIRVNVISNTNQTDPIENDTNTALVAKAGQLFGLKRKVVVFVMGRTECDDSVIWNIKRGFTSCTSQLVLVYTPKS